MFLRWLFPLKCPLCGEIIDGKTPRLCPSCYEKWQKELTLGCPVCAKRPALCRCHVPSLHSLLIPDDKLSFLSSGWYDPMHCPVSSELVYRLKHSKSDEPAWIFAYALAGPIASFLKESGEEPREWIVVFPPRTDDAIRKEGFDQAERLAKRLARLLGSECKSVFRRKGGKVQKKLDKQERKENARNSIRIKAMSRIAGRKMILCDDVVTTGATTARCVQLLYQAGADSVLTVSALRTPPRKKL